MSEKTEKATAWKLKKAREKGQVSKSMELNTSIFLLVTGTVLAVLFPVSLHHIQLLMQRLLSMSPDLYFSSTTIHHLFQIIFSECVSLWLPLCLAALVIIVLIHLLQTGFIWTLQPLKPSWKRLHPVEGFKKLFSSKTGFDLLKYIFKLLLVFLAAILVFKPALPQIVSLSQYAAVNPALPQNLLYKIPFQFMTILTAAALLDVLYSRWKFAKEQRMSKQELRDEYKQKEGDPHTKSRIRHLQNQMRKKTASLQAVKTAKIVITNPTHIAIALKYESETMPAPMVICKAQGKQVEIVKQIARKHRIPIVDHKPLAWLLFQNIPLNHWITPDLYPLVASVLRNLLISRGQE